MTRAYRRVKRNTRKQTRRRRQTRRVQTSRRRLQTRGRRRITRMRGGGLPIPSGAVAGVRLDPTDEYSAPVLVRKEEFEEEVLDEE